MDRDRSNPHTTMHIDRFPTPRPDSIDSPSHPRTTTLHATTTVTDAVADASTSKQPQRHNHPIKCASASGSRASPGLCTRGATLLSAPMATCSTASSRTGACVGLFFVFMHVTRHARGPSTPPRHRWPASSLSHPHPQGDHLRSGGPRLRHPPLRAHAPHPPPRRLPRRPPPPLGGQPGVRTYV